MIFAEVIEKRPWHDGQFINEDGIEYRTRQIMFKTNDGHIIHINVSVNHRNSMIFNDLKIGDKICNFVTLKDKHIISPDSRFRIYSIGALF